MAASMRNVAWRSIFPNILKCHCPKQNIPAATYCEKAVADRNRLKFDMSSLDIDDKHGTEVSKEEDVPKMEENQSFASLFRKSRLVQMGELKDKTMAGRIIDVVHDDLYIDFGGKFYCVCPRPSFQSDQFVKGQRVKISMHKFEMSSSFLGSDKHVTLLEADCTLVGLFDPPQREQLNKTSSDSSVVSGGFASRMMSMDDSAKDNTEIAHDSEEKFDSVVTEGSSESVKTKEEK